MNQFFYVYVRCYGRLANQLWSWAKGRHVIQSLNNRKLLINYAELGQCDLPNTDNRILDTSTWPEADTSGIAACNADCVWTDSWGNFPPEEVVKKYLDQIIFTNPLLEQVGSLLGKTKTIGVHIRYGDFLAVDPNKPISMQSFLRASNDYYISMLDCCRGLLPDHAVFLATDGTPDEVRWFTDRYHPLQHAERNAMLDLVTLSKCDFIVGSNSTFSLLASVWGQKPIVVPGCTLDQVRQLTLK